MVEPVYVFAGGGTGGHLYPGISVAEALREAEPQARIVFLTTNRPLDRQLLAPTGFEQIEQPVRPFTLHPARLPRFWLDWRRSMSAARRLIQSRRAVAVLGLGGYAAGPAVVAAHSLGVFAAILNPDAVPGRANRYLAARSNLVVLQWDSTRRYFGHNVHCEVLGCPIRRQFHAVDSAAGRRHFELDATRPVLLVTGASQGARTVNETLVRVWPEVSRSYPEWQLLHLTGETDEASVRRAYSAAGAAAKVRAFTHEMALALAAADLVVSRAGASTLAELTALGKPAILMPYPFHRDRHQHLNAAELVAAGAAELVEDHRDGTRNAPGLRAALDRALSPGALREMAQAALAMGRPRAAWAVAERLADGPRAPGGGPGNS
jgi:UDP-N-acetylglucosamine--N-acetylmuramyl-(pentapeptide) pyrophosphoryl-undecaprenol N-acetylglucosamine transferase